MKPSYFLFVNAVAYIGLGILCAVAPWKTAELIGLNLIGPKGLVEYLAVYGGLEFGLGLFFAYSFFNPLTHKTAIIFATFLYSGIVAFRGLGMIFYSSPTEDLGWLLYSVEITCLVLSILILRSSKFRI